MADISRTEVSTLIEENYSHALLSAAAESSTALRAFPIVNMGTKTTHLPVLATLPTAGWVSESATEATGLKPTSQVTWQDLTLVAEEVATIVPVHENVIDDATVNIIEDIVRLAGAAIGKVLDQAVFWGTSKPASWVSDALYMAAAGAAQTQAVTAGAANADDLVGAVNQAAKSLALVGLMPDTLVGSLTLRYDVANLRDSSGLPIFRDESFAGFDTHFVRNGSWDSATAEALIVDSSMVRIGVRQDIQVKLLDQATLTVGSDQINLAQRDMIALRFKARYAYVLGTGANQLSASPVPVAAITPAGS